MPGSEINMCFCEIGTHEQAGTATPPTPQHSSGGEEASVADTEHLEGHLRFMFDGLMDKLRKDETFQAPNESLVSSYEKIRSDSGLLSAFSTFGKMRSPAAARNIKRRPRSGLQTRTQIGVQPAAVARRKTPLGGRWALITGGLPKRASREHTPLHSMCLLVCPLVANTAKNRLSLSSDFGIHIFYLSCSYMSAYFRLNSDIKLLF